MNRIASSSPTTIDPREKAYLKQQPEYRSIESLAEMWPQTRSRFGDILALFDPHAKPQVKLTYRQLVDRMEQFAAGVQALGLPAIADRLPPRVALFANNSPLWIIADSGLILAGAADVVRGSDADAEELLYILKHSGSMALVVDNRAVLNKLRPGLDDLPIQWIVLLSEEEPIREQTLPVPVLTYSEVMAKGAKAQRQPAPLKRDTVATLIYTSGTTGFPKGVMLTHGNLLHQITNLSGVIQPQPGDRLLSILPTWHTFGRTGEYFCFSQGCTQIYTNLRSLKSDFKEHQPQFMVAVPRLWESIYDGVQKQFRQQPANKQKLVNTLLGYSQRYVEAGRTLKGLHLSPHPPSVKEKGVAAIQRVLLWPLHAIGVQLVYKKVRQATGGKLKYAISGGGSLAMHIETFLEIVGLQVLVGYGLTETSPVLTARRFWHNLRGSAGRPIVETEIRIVDPETRQPLPIGEKGLVLARGPQVMQGYYQNPEATRKAIDPEGWFDTGDLGWMTPGWDLVLTGRAKDTIVLTNGENIEPQPIEDACLRSPYISQIMLVGQDEKSLGALIVPDFDALEKWAAAQNLRLRLPGSESGGELSPDEITLESPQVRQLFRQELNREVKNRPSYRPDDRIGPFRTIAEPFSMDNGLLTQTLKIKRPVVMERYLDAIADMFARS